MTIGLAMLYLTSFITMIIGIAMIKAQRELREERRQQQQQQPK